MAKRKDTKRKNNQLGFDLEAAMKTLHAEAIKAGAVPEGDHRAVNPLYTATAHLHGVEHDRCKKSPCRVAGLCHALYELVQFRDEVNVATPFIAAADETEVMRKAMFEAGIQYAKTLERRLVDSEKIHQQETEQEPSFQRHNHDVLCVCPERIIQLMAELQMLLEVFEDKLRSLPGSFQLQQSSYSKRSTLLLTAVYQHLRWGGLKYAKIAELVPDELGKKKGADERVRGRVKGPNARSIVPAELMGKLRKEKRSRAKKPKPEAPDPRDSSG